jgi:Tol biopolymer transport system component
MEIYRLNAETGNDIKRLTDTDGNAYPVVSADNQWVAYDHVAEVGRSVWKVPLAGGEPVRVAERYRMPAFSPDGQMIATRFDRKSGTRDIAIFPAGGGAPLHRINVPVLEWQRIGWLDNQTLTFIKNVGGISNIWSYDLASGTSKQLTNFNGDQIFAYAWSPDFRQLVSLRGLKTSDVTLIGE